MYAREMRVIFSVPRRTCHIEMQIFYMYSIVEFLAVYLR